MSGVGSVTNQEFLRAVFRGVGGDSFLWVTSFRGDPKSASNQEWTGKPYRINSPVTVDEGGNTFFNIATVKEHGGKVARKEGNFDALHVVVLDDIGTKAALPEGVEPSYLLETSKGNCQAGFILDPPCKDLARVKAQFKASADQGLTDKGAQGPQSRYVRLPVGVNHKPKCGPNGFAHRLASWAPERRFTVEGLCELFGLNLEVEPAATAKPVIRTATADRTDRTDGVVTAIVLRSDKARRVWAGDDSGFGSGSDADQYLLNLIAFCTESAEQVERVYSQSPRATRKSADGVCKWEKRDDYRKRSIEAAFCFVEKHPHGDTESARATIEAAVAVAKASDDARGIYAADVVEAFSVLRRGDIANHEHFRKQVKKVGVNLTALDGEILKVGDSSGLSHSDAADFAIASLGGAESILSHRGAWWQWRQEVGVWKRIESDETIKKAIHAVLPKRQLIAATVGSVLSVLRTRVARDDVVFDRPSSENVINCRNGTLDLRDVGFHEGLIGDQDRWELRPHRREDYHTACVPVEWKPSAQCPRFERFLEDITRDDVDGQDKRQTLIEAIGYSLTPTTKEERFVILYGESSSNGKSTLLQIVRALAGAENTSALTLLQLGERFGLAGLQGKLVNLCAEIPRGAVLADDAIKKLVSGDTITVERKGKDHHEINPFATLWFATNTLPNLRDLSPATLEKRCILIELNRTFRGEDRDARLFEKLTEELEGIFYLCVETYGAMLVSSREPSTWTAINGKTEPAGWLGGLMEDPPSSVRAKAAWRQASDPVRQFADERLVVDVTKQVESAELYGAWTAWIEANGVRLSLTRHHLVGRLKSMFPQIRTGDEARQGRKRGIGGLGLADS